MPSVHTPLAASDSSLAEMAIHVSRRTLGQKVWHGAADDGVDFAFELSAPLREGDVVFQSAASRYVIRQRAEPLLEIALNIAPSAAAGIGWAIGNLHLELSADPARLFTPDEPATRQLLERLRVPFTTTNAVFRPGRFARGTPQLQNLGESHHHPAKPAPPE